MKLPKKYILVSFNAISFLAIGIIYYYWQHYYEDQAYLIKNAELSADESILIFRDEKENQCATRILSDHKLNTGSLDSVRIYWISGNPIDPHDLVKSRITLTLPNNYKLDTNIDVKSPFVKVYYSSGIVAAYCTGSYSKSVNGWVRLSKGRFGGMVLNSDLSFKVKNALDDSDVKDVHVVGTYNLVNTKLKELDENVRNPAQYLEKIHKLQLSDE